MKLSTCFSAVSVCDIQVLLFGCFPDSFSCSGGGVPDGACFGVGRSGSDHRGFGVF